MEKNKHVHNTFISMLFSVNCQIYVFKTFTKFTCSRQYRSVLSLTEKSACSLGRLANGALIAAKFFSIDILYNLSLILIRGGRSAFFIVIVTKKKDSD